MKNCVITRETNGNDCCSSCSNNINTNCPCSYCEKLKVEDVDINKAKCLLLKYNKLIECAKLCHDDFVVGKVLVFYLDKPNDNFTDGDRVCVNTIETNYDFIGLSQLILNNSETFINGESYYLNPKGLFNVGSESIPEYLFDSLYGNIDIKPSCCCNLDSSDEYYCARIVETAKFFEVSNLTIKVTGFIGCTPFSATAVISDNINEGANNIRLTSLGILSGAAFVTNMCIPRNTRKLYLNENFKSNLEAECVRILSDYKSTTAVDEKGGSFAGSVDFSIHIEKDIYLCSRERGFIYSYPYTKLKS